MNICITLRSVISIFLILGISNSAWAIDASSSSYILTIPVFMSGGGTTSSAVYDTKVSAIGENCIYLYELTSSNNTLRTGQIYMLVGIPTVLPPEMKVISDLKAQTQPLGAVILEKTWQRDNDPYFYWKIEIVPPTLLEGCSVALDSTPDFTVDTRWPSYQFLENSILSGKHIFYVLPIVLGKGPDEKSMLNFEIWVDVDPPFINQLTPHPGDIVTDKFTLVSCLVSDKDSGLDLNQTILTINNNTVGFDYHPETQLLISKSGFVLNEGLNTVLLRAYDVLGNNVVRGWDFIVDTQPPTGSVLINSGQEITHSAYVSLNIKAEDLVSDIKSIYISNDGVFDTEMNQPFNYQPVIANWLLAEPDIDGTKTVYVKFRDTAGNLSITYKDDIYLKRLTPDTRIISGPATVTENTEADFKYEASKAGCKFSYKLDNLNWSDWSDLDAAHLSGLTVGNHYFYVKAGLDLNSDNRITIDEEDATPAQWVWTVQPEGYFEKIKKRILFWRR